MQRLLERVRGKRHAHWPWPRRRAADHDHPSRPHDETGLHVHGDDVPRLKYRSVEELGESLRNPGTEVGAFKIRLARPPEPHHPAGAHVQKVYPRTGYLASATQTHPSICTFTAYDEGRLAGTVSLRLDSKDGLFADKLYKREIDALRREGRRVCEFSRLAVDTSRVSRPVLAGLFHTVLLYAQRIHGFDYIVIEVNPRHVGYYRHVLWFDVIGPQRRNARAHAPAVLMGVSFQKVGDNLHRYAGKGMRATRTRNLYVYGFSPAEEMGILGRLRKRDLG